MSIFTIQKGQQLEQTPGVFHLVEQGFTTDAPEIQFGIFRRGEYLGAMYIKMLEGGVEIYIPSTPESELSRIGEKQFNLGFTDVSI